MNRINQFLLLLSCFLSIIACRQEEGLITEGGETTTVYLKIGGLESNDVQAITRYVDATPYEGLRTLRVIVTDKGMTKIHCNQKTNVIVNPTEPTSSLNTVTITIPDIPVGELNFYVIANEESIGKEYDNETLMNDEKQNNKLLFIDNTDPHFFPKKGPEIKKLGLPMSGMKTININKYNNQVAIDLRRAVTKLSLTVENATNGPIVLQNVEFGSFFGDRLYVFPEYQLDVPEGSSYAPLSYKGVNMTIPATGSTDKLSAYLYPTYAYSQGDSPYTISIETDKNKYDKLVFAPNVNSFPRNTQVNIHARITTTTGITLNFAVTDWDDYIVNVPDFN